MSHAPIYLDHNATTPLHPEIWGVMERIVRLGEPLNPSSLHVYGQRAKALLAQARALAAESLDVLPQEVLFTSGGTESLNLLIRGLLPPAGGIVLYSAADHKAITETLRALEKMGYRGQALHPDVTGHLSVDQIAGAITPQVVLMVFSAANGETGVLTDVAALGSLAAWHRIPLVIDAVALLGKEKVRMLPGVSGLALSAHKAHGPTGAGLAILRKHLTLRSLHTGGGQEHGRRAGTEALVSWVGAAHAVAMAQASLVEAAPRMAVLRHRLEEGLRQLYPQLIVIGENQSRLCNTSCVSFPGLEGELLVIELDREGVCVSHGTACSAGAHELSPALRAMQLPLETIRGSIRLSLGRFTREEEIDEALIRFQRVLDRQHARR